MHCPKCAYDIPDSIVKAYTASLAGAKGRGASKAHSSEKARAAVNKRWDNYYRQLGIERPKSKAKS